MKLLVAGVTWPPETFLRQRLEGLARRGVEVTAAVSVPRRRAARPGLPGVLQGVRMVRLPHWDDPKLLRAWRAIWASAWWKAARGEWRRWPAYAALARLRPEVVHFEWNSVAIDYWPLVERWRRPVVISCRGSQIQVRPHLPGQEEYVRGLERTLGGATAVHCVSAAIREEAAKFGLDRRKAVVIRPAVDAEFFQPGGGRRGDDAEFRIVSTGSLHWVKGHEYALAAVRKLVDDGLQVRFEIIGDGKKAERQRLQYAIQDLGLESVARLRGALPPAAVREALQQADAFLLASLSEGISNAALEAMACAVPVVTTGCGGMREAVSDGVEGFVVPVRDPAAMAGALAKLAGDRELRERLGRAGRERVLREFTLARQMDDFLSLYRRLVA